MCKKCSVKGIGRLMPQILSKCLVIRYSRVHISSDEVFSKILKKPSIVQKKMMPHMKAFGLLNKMKQKNTFFEKKSKWPPKKKDHFPAPPILKCFCENIVDWSLGL